MAAPIGILDSGIGGLSVASKIMQYLPNEEILYFGDTANVPYGEKTPEEIKYLVFSVMDYLMDHNVKAIVMACNTSSALVLEHAKKRYNVPVIGVIDSSAAETVRLAKTGRVGLFANTATVASGAHQKAIDKIAHRNIRVVGQACPKLVPLVERGITQGPEAEQVIREYLRPIEESGADTLILGCTHYPFLQGVIRKVAKKGLKIVDPAELTAKKLRGLLLIYEMMNNKTIQPRHRFIVSGQAEPFRQVGSQVMGRGLSIVEHYGLELPVSA